METVSKPAATEDTLGVIDLHSHPTLKSYMFGTKFWKAHRAPSGFYPLAMCVDIDALMAGGVKAFACATYVVERELFSDVRALGLLTAIMPRAKHIATAPMDALTREYLDFAESMVEETRRRRGDVIEIARNFGDYERITSQGRICMLHTIEGAHHLNGNIDMVDELKTRGVCKMVIPHLYPNESGGCVDMLTHSRRYGVGFDKKFQDESGLSAWGCELVEKLLDIGIIVDPTHGTREYRRKMIEIARNHPKKRPVIMSHVYMPVADETPRSPEPDDIREIAETGGVIGLMMAVDLHAKGYAHRGIEIALASMDYLIQHGGEDVVAIGSDFDGFTKVPKDLQSPRDYAGLRHAMLRKYTPAQVAKFLNGNAQRALKMGWGN